MSSGRKSKAARRHAQAPRPPSATRRFGPRWLWVGIAALAAAGLAAGLTLTFATGTGGTKLPLAPLSRLGPLAPAPPLGPPGPEGPPLEHGPTLAPAAAPAPGASVDGIECEASEQVLLHIHARLTVFVDGKEARVPYGVGIGRPWQVEQTPQGAFVTSGACFSWLHTHAADGIIHIESPVQRTYTLGELFDIWHQPLTPTRVGPQSGRVVALLNGKVWTGKLRSIPLLAHAQIQLEVGRPLVAPVLIHQWGDL